MGNHTTQHSNNHAFTALNARDREGLLVYSRRSTLKAGLAGMAGLSLPNLIRTRAEAAQSGRVMKSNKSVILLWMAGGPSHIDMLDPKPDAPAEIRGPFGTLQTALPGVRFCEHLPKQAAMMDKMTVIRSVDCRGSNHEPNKVMQTGNRAASPRTNPEGEKFPAIASLVGKFRGSNHPAMPAYATFMRSRSHVAFAGYLGKKYDPFLANNAAKLPTYDLVGKDLNRTTPGAAFNLPGGLTHDQLLERRTLMQHFDNLRTDLDLSGSMNVVDQFTQQAVEMVSGHRAQEAFDVSREHPRTVDRYGNHLWCQQTLLARRLVEAGVSFVTLDLSYHTASDTWDTHGDNIPPYGGIKNGLGPLLPLYDHLITTLVDDLDQRGMLDDVLVIAMGEFGRTPKIGTQGSSDGRNHWPVVMSMTLAGGGFNHGQIIGATEKDAGQIKERPVTPGDLAATIYQHMDVPLDGHYLDFQGRPRMIVEEGAPIAELVG